MNILSIQSHVAYDHVGNASAVFPMQRLGHEVWPIHTVQFSNHTGYGAWRGDVFPASLIEACVTGIAERGVLGQCNGVLSGYVGTPETGEAILSAVAAVKAANPNALYCCDPVIGDVGRGVFVRAGVPDFFSERALGVADIVTPNQFELDYLTGIVTADDADFVRALSELHRCGPRVILVTSLITAQTPDDALDIAVSANGIIARVRTPRLNVSLNGAGDAIAALFLVHYLATRSAQMALSRAVSSVFGLFKRTMEAGSRELLLIAAQDEFVTPSRLFEPEILTA